MLNHQKQNSAQHSIHANNSSIDNTKTNQQQACQRLTFLLLGFLNYQKRQFNLRIISNIQNKDFQHNPKFLLIMPTESISCRPNQSITLIKKTGLNRVQIIINWDKGQKLKEVNVQTEILKNMK
jgi:hypothetical protein